MKEYLEEPGVLNTVEYHNPHCQFLFWYYIYIFIIWFLNCIWAIWPAVITALYLLFIWFSHCLGRNHLNIYELRQQQYQKNTIVRAHDINHHIIWRDVISSYHLSCFCADVDLDFNPLVENRSCGVGCVRAMCINAVGGQGAASQCRGRYELYYIWILMAFSWKNESHPFVWCECECEWVSESSICFCILSVYSC